MSSQTVIEVAGRRIGDGAPCFVIAEAGVNHNGDVELAMQLVDAAAEAGADAVKFQTWRTEKLVAPAAPLADYQRTNVAGADDDQYALLEALELTADEFRRLDAHARKRGILFLSTPDEEDSADLLDEIGVPLFKIGSGEVTNLPLLRHIAAKGKPLVLSTGMANLGEVELAVEALLEAGAPGIVLLQCVSAYPAEPADANLRAMATLRTAFRLPVGFSDHTLGDETALAAVALGACVLEKHLTLSTDLEGPDHRASLEPVAFADLVRRIRLVESALGDGRKRPTPAEKATKEVVRRRILAGRDLAAGTVLSLDDIVLRRASEGEFVETLEQLIGRTLMRAVGGGEPIRRVDVR
jgi:N-acetylneuraminate synthase/N,N'-diacetyllegionaminate synthase